MPRELVHWAVLESARLALPEESETRRLLDSYSAAAQLGAVLHDAPYFHKWGRGGFVKAGDILHGLYPCDTSGPLKNCFAAAVGMKASGPRDEILAMLSGMLSHLVTDSVFHPYIFYFTGDYHALDSEERRAAQTAHRIFEVYLDSWVLQERSELFTSMEHGGSRLIGARERNCIYGADKLYAFLNAELSPQLLELEAQFDPVNLLAEQTDAARDWKPASRSLIRLQKLFVSGYGRRLATFLVKRNPIFFTGYEALFSAGRSQVLSDFQQIRTYRNPVSGAFCRAFGLRSVRKSPATAS